MTTKKIVVKLPSYAEARPVAEIVQTASRFDSEIYLISGNKKINAKSILVYVTKKRSKLRQQETTSRMR